MEANLRPFEVTTEALIPDGDFQHPDFEREYAQLEDLYESWERDVLKNQDTVSLREIVENLQTDSSAQGDLVREMSGYIVLVALDSGNQQSPLQSYNVALRAMVQRAATMEVASESTNEELIDFFVDTAIEASKEMLLTKPELTEAVEIAEPPAEEAPAVDPAEELEQYEPLPPLADERSADTFSVGQKVLVLVGDKLKRATVKTAEAYESPITLGTPTAISEEGLKRRQAQLEVEQLRAGFMEGETMQGVVPNPNVLRMKMAMCPEFQRVELNPSPGFLHLVFEGGSVITDMHHNYVIPEDAWNIIRRSETYRGVWLAHGSEESSRLKHVLEQAIQEKVVEAQRSPVSLAV